MLFAGLDYYFCDKTYSQYNIRLFFCDELKLVNIFQLVPLLRNTWTNDNFFLDFGRQNHMTFVCHVG